MNWHGASETSFQAAVVIYLAATALYLIHLATKHKLVGRAATWMTMAAVAAHSLGLIFRWVQGGIDHPPFTNLYESLLFFSWGIALFYLILERKYGFREGGAFILPVALGAIGAAALNPAAAKQVNNLLPALQSHWLHAHVAVAAIAYAAFVASFGASLMFLIKDGAAKQTMASWANVFMAFMLLVSDRLNILKHRVFSMELVDPSGAATGLSIPLSGAGKLFLVAVCYFAVAAVFYRLSAPDAAAAVGKGRAAGPASGFGPRLLPFAPLATALGVGAVLIGVFALDRATRLSPRELSAIAGGMEGEDAAMAASAIVEHQLALSFRAIPFKLIILLLVAFVGSATVFLDLKFEWIQKALPRAELLDALSYTIITIAFPLMTMVIVTGAVWAKYAFGKYWQWDPKETASLITWLIYTGYLHARVSLNWSSRSVAVISILGFASVVFTYLGVNVIGPGYHAYASL